MIKISKIDAHKSMNEIDFKLMDQELFLVSNSDQSNGRDMTTQFFFYGYFNGIVDNLMTKMIFDADFMGINFIDE